MKSGCFICDVDYLSPEHEQEHKRTVEHVARLAEWRYESRGRMGFHTPADDAPDGSRQAQE